jgi:hypothetical protein
MMPSHRSAPGLIHESTTTTLHLHLPPGLAGPGQCRPLTVQVNSNVTWYWCGFRSEKRTEYWFNSVSHVHL